MCFGEHAGQEPTCPVSVAPGTQVDHYRIVSAIGAGGMGEVFLAEDLRLSRQVALKFLPVNLCHDQACQRRFRREAQATARLDHPNIVTVYGVGDYQGRPFIRVVDHLPATKDTAGTNFCDITVRMVRGRAVVISCIDNLLKGASGAAVQNFNVMYGFQETTAL